MILPVVVNVSIWGFVLMSVKCLKHSLNVPNVIWHQKSSSTCVTTAWSCLLLLLLLMTLSLGSGGRRRFHTQFTQVFFTAGNSLYCSQIRADSSASNLRHVWALQQLEPDFSSTIKFFHCNLLISRLINLEYQLMLEIEIWHCFNLKVVEIFAVSWNCLVVSSPPFLIEVENPLRRRIPPTSSLYHYGIVSHHSHKLAKITVYFFFSSNEEMDLQTLCLKITKIVSFQFFNSIFCWMKKYFINILNCDQKLLRIQLHSMFVKRDFLGHFQTLCEVRSFPKQCSWHSRDRVRRETWHHGQSIQTDEWTIVYRAWNRWWW